MERYRFNGIGGRKHQEAGGKAGCENGQLNWRNTIHDKPAFPFINQTD